MPDNVTKELSYLEVIGSIIPAESRAKVDAITGIDLSARHTTPVDA